MSLRRRVEIYLKRSRISASRFGREAVNDSSFVIDLREGREVGEKVAARVNAWIDRQYRERRRR